jgi:L-alanine-DL-glutamate epimerase-like enolase superfamily enzyme
MKPHLLPPWRDGDKDIATDVTKEMNGKIEKGYLYPPKGPGLGVELNEDRVKRYAASGVSTIMVK